MNFSTSAAVIFWPSTLSTTRSPDSDWVFWGEAPWGARPADCGQPQSATGKMNSDNSFGNGFFKAPSNAEE